MVQVREKRMKKILQIKNGEYLHSLLKNKEGILTGIDSTYHKQFALDISNWSLEQLGHISSNLEKVGYKPQVLIIEEDDGNDTKV